MAKNDTMFALLLSLLAFTPVAYADTQAELIKKVEQLRNSAFDSQSSGNNSGALAAISQAGDLVLSREFTDPSKPVVETMVITQLTTIHGSAFQKRDWAVAEAALRKKISFMEACHKDNTDDYQASLRSLNMVLRAQKKSTEASVIKPKMKPLSFRKEDKIQVNLQAEASRENNKK
ncbi:MAG: hypothetical protein K2W82_19695 [Candidatus Obscuribacterales bacterium]|nr:hypothetical protein [Candidatus Obscuribacterales bacterium]